jgi:hypothetical protein
MVIKNVFKLLLFLSILCIVCTNLNSSSIYQVEEIEICGLVHTRSMWMVERHLKSLKALVRQRARPEGSMVEGYAVYQSMVYISQYLPKLAAPTMHVVDCIWDVTKLPN